MNESSSKISLIASRLPYTDRRALSEAWFSALHLASNDPGSRAGSERLGAATSEPPGTGRVHAIPDSRRTTASGRVLTPYPRRSASRSAAIDPPRPRISAASRPNAARECMTRARSYAPFRTSLTVGTANERVHLLLRRDGATLHVIAICRASVAETVRRALALADAHLRVKGEFVRSSVRPYDRAGAPA